MLLCIISVPVHNGELPGGQNLDSIGGEKLLGLMNLRVLVVNLITTHLLVSLDLPLARHTGVKRPSDVSSIGKTLPVTEAEDVAVKESPAWKPRNLYQPQKSALCQKETCIFHCAVAWSVSKTERIRLLGV